MKKSEDQNIHVIPIGLGHVDSKDCFCEPTLSYKDENTGIEVWVHRGPEEMEQ